VAAVDVAVQPSFENGFDVVLSDMAPNTSGIKILDVSASHDLCHEALQISQRVLKPNGTLVMVSAATKIVRNARSMPVLPAASHCIRSCSFVMCPN